MYVVYFLGSRNYKRAFLYFLGAAVPILDIYLWIKAGLRGRRLVWESGKWQDFESYRKRQKLLDKVGLVILLVSVLIWLAVFAFGYFNGVKTSDQAQIPSANTEANSSQDIDRVRIILEDIRQGYITDNKALVIKHSSVETASLLSNDKKRDHPASSFTVNSVFESGANVVANVTIVSDGETTTQELVFIKENNDWKFDISATFEREMSQAVNQAEAKKGTGDPSGLPDLVVVSTTVFPNRPIVNNKEVEITVTIKNAGTKTSDGGAPLVATLLGFTDGTPVQGGALYPITPGETVTWSFHPYGQNEFFKISDTPGQKTIQIVLNKDREIKESNYNNNVFTQTVQMFSN